ncbi:hypothetical protein COV04_00225 [Candidatus Uhrbacteria bacterium CG10_big_fil_rev_8_21_14_0_10_48_11]|uniref:Thioredoxin domain-containing protein n=1 Tax=Candidatus Uhrbacteria bacterium CG10_big_fil_rev_8_21_14_0_10_48_11 TaxID=1975037 RepID=A0A2M8LFU0_9BACT|nr:MAG: hypothetical protein COV04_00225 [Candidatus Uhrbacteria bacterium CG10_big_fil_rev_8_21_14_0_10_48_11]
MALGPRIYSRLATTIPADQNSGALSVSSLPPAISSADADKLIREDSPVVGPSDAPVTIVEFADFQCPFCEESFPVIRSLMSIYEGKLRFVYRQFPVVSLHPDAPLAAEASLCAAAQDMFLIYHDKLFLNQSALDQTSLERYAVQVGMNSQTFNTCLTNHQQQSAVARDVVDGTALGVRGTPTWFINGHKIEGAIPADLFRKIIEVFITTQ